MVRRLGYSKTLTINRHGRSGSLLNGSYVITGQEDVEALVEVISVFKEIRYRSKLRIYTSIPKPLTIPGWQNPCRWRTSRDIHSTKFLERWKIVVCFIVIVGRSVLAT
jgi:hypothetical protein